MTVSVLARRMITVTLAACLLAGSTADPFEGRSEANALETRRCVPSGPDCGDAALTAHHLMRAVARNDASGHPLGGSPTGPVILLVMGSLGLLLGARRLLRRPSRERPRSQ
jgi:hypothetical protein